MSRWVPHVVERIPGGGERSSDIFSRFLKERHILVSGQVDDAMADSVIVQLLLLEAETRNLSAADQKKNPITMVINSPGGSITAGLAIVDVMRHIQPKVNTTAVGLAASMGAVLLAAGTGVRKATTHARIMIHQASGGFRGTTEDAKRALKEQDKLESDLYKLLSKATGQSITTIKKDCDRDFYMSAEEAVKYGLIDKVVR